MPTKTKKTAVKKKPLYNGQHRIVTYVNDEIMKWISDKAFLRCSNDSAVTREILLNAMRQEEK